MEDGLTCISVSTVATSSSYLHTRILLSSYAARLLGPLADLPQRGGPRRAPPGAGRRGGGGLRDFMVNSHDSTWGLCGLLQTPLPPKTLYKRHSLSVLLLMGSRCSPQSRRRHQIVSLLIPRTETAAQECMGSRGSTLLHTWSSSGGNGDTPPHH